MTKRVRRSFSPEFKAEAAALVLDPGYNIAAASRAMDVEATPLHRWVEQLRQERGDHRGRSPGTGRPGALM